MGEEAGADREQHDVSGLDLLDGPTADEEHIAWPDCGKHAVPVDPHTRLTKTEQHFSDQGRSGVRQDVFRTDLHAPLVGFTLPQASAIVSNTCSRTKAGFS
jgi:hypothetical protein